MARRNHPQTPEEKKRTGILFAIIGILVLILGIYVEINGRKMEKQCISTEIGTVASVDTKKVRSGSRTKHRAVSRSRYHYEYLAHVTFGNGSPLSGRNVQSRWSRTEYKTGQSVKVFYNPDDPSMYYVEGASPQDGGGMMIVGIVFFGVGIFSFVQGKKEMGW